MKNFKNLKALVLSLLVVGSIFSNLFSFTQFPYTSSTLEIDEVHEDVL